MNSARHTFAIFEATEPHEIQIVTPIAATLPNRFHLHLRITINCNRPDAGQKTNIEFSPERWDLTQARIVEHLGRKALSGTAFLKDVTFEDGIIAVDFAVTGARSYPGIIFRMEKPGEYERIGLSS